MLTIKDYDVDGFEPAIRGMRNPMNSWDKSDSGFDEYDRYYVNIGKNDLKLMKSLVKSGTDHSKFMRMIIVYADVIAPLYWWKEYDTYKVGTVANSCSTMHKIHDKEFTLEDFSHEHLTPLALSSLNNVIDMLNHYRADFSLTKMKEDWWQMIQLLPSSYNQKRTIMLNYQVLMNIYYARKDHKLDEWNTFCDWILTLPYFKEIISKED